MTEGKKKNKKKCRIIANIALLVAGCDNGNFRNIVANYQFKYCKRLFFHEFVDINSFNAYIYAIIFTLESKVTSQ